MTGIFIADEHSYTMRTAIGLIAGPLRPPKMFDSCGRRVSTSIDIARNFGKGDVFGLGLAFLGVIFYPILGFGNARYQATYDISL